MTRHSPQLFAVLGDPVDHSLSPTLHNSALKSLGLNAEYVAIRVAADEVESTMRALAASGGGGNVTVPHKRAAAAALDSSSAAVASTGACNTFWWSDDAGLCGDNTDVVAFVVSAERLVERLRGARVLLLGAGGSARAVAHACRSSGVGELHVLNRTIENARHLIRDLSLAEASVLQSESDLNPPYDLVVNATSLGLSAADPLPLTVPPGTAAALLDLAYGPDETPLVRAAREAGLAAEDGLGMLVEGAALSFERWYPGSAPRAAMAAAVGRGGDG